MSLAATVAVLLAAGLDRAVAEPPSRAHPVAWFGSLVVPVDREWSNPRAVGLLAAVVLPLVAAITSATVVGGASAIGKSVGWGSDQLLATIAAAVILFVCTSLRMLVDTASDVVALAGEDVASARDDLLALAGRDASTLSAAHVRSAAVESAAENLADGLVAPLLAFALGAAAASLISAEPTVALAIATAAAAWVKGVNTLDSMLGYRSKPVGWASARLDDAVMWIPARVAAVLIAVAASAPRALVDARRDTRVPTSPNSGWPMATLAHVLEVRLEKPGAYALNADANLPAATDAERGIRVVSTAGWLGVGLVGVIAAV